MCTVLVGAGGGRKVARVSPQEFAAKWESRLSGATAEITAGVNRVQQAPGAKAAAAVDTWLAKVQASRDKWVRNTGRVSLEQWRSKMVNVGIPRIASGAQANSDKVATFAAEFLPYLDRGVQQVRAMPKANLEQSIQRATAMMRWNAQFRRGAGGGATPHP